MRGKEIRWSMRSLGESDLQCGTVGGKHLPAVKVSRHFFSSGSHAIGFERTNTPKKRKERDTHPRRICGGPLCNDRNGRIGQAAYQVERIQNGIARSRKDLRKSRFHKDHVPRLCWKDIYEPDFGPLY